MSSEPEDLRIQLTKFLFKTVSKPAYRDFADRIKLQGREQVLDFGAGMGAVAYYVARKLPKGRLVCNDISGKWMQELKKTLRGYMNVEPLLGEVYSIGLEVKSFDVIYSHFALHEVAPNELEKVISHLAFLMKHQARFYIREPLENKQAIANLLELIEEAGLELESSQEISVPYLGKALDAVFVKR